MCFLFGFYQTTVSERVMRELSFSAPLWTEGVDILAAIGVCVCVYGESLHFGRLQFIQMEQLLLDKPQKIPPTVQVSTS